MKMMQMENKTKTSNVKWLVINSYRLWIWLMSMRMKKFVGKKSQMNYQIQGKLKGFFNELRTKGSRYKIVKMSDGRVFQKLTENNKGFRAKRSKKLLIGLKYIKNTFLHFN